MNIPPLVYILVLNWNRLNDTIACLDSVFKLEYSNFRVLFIDNGSQENPEKTLLERFPSIETLENGTNLGFAGGFNAGIRKVIQTSAHYLWILNNDTIVTPNSLSIMVETMQKRPRIGVASPIIQYHNQPKEIWFSGGRIQLWRGMAENFSHPPTTLEPFPCNFITGCAMLVRAEVFRDCGLFREDYFLNIEDWEFCRRVAISRYEFFVFPRSVIYHKVGLSKDGEHSYLDYYYFVRNRLHFINDCLPLILKFIAFTIFFVHLPLWILKLSIHGDWQTIRATRDGLADFIRGKRGPQNT